MEVQIAILVVMVICSAFFSASETALTSSNRIRLKSMAENGSHGAKLALKLIEKYDKVITTILIGNNIVNITASSIGTLIATQFIDDPDTAALVSTVALTLIILTFGEVMPKSIAKDHAESFSSKSSGIVTFLTFIFTPLSAFFILLKKLISKIFGSKKEVTVTEQELIAIIDEIEDEGVLEEQEHDLVKSALEFDETVVDEIITHRVDVTAVDINEDIETVKETFINEEYSRLPVYEGSIDHICGFVSQKDFFKRYITCGDEKFILRDIVQEIHYVPHLMKISDVMKQMQHDKIHMAVVLDQYGGTLGIVTLEDILEQLVGEIWDENDEIVAPVSFISDNEFSVNGDVSLTVFKRYWHKRTGEYAKVDSSAKTVGGWVLELFGKIPEAGETVSTKDFTIKVLKINGRRIAKVLFSINSINGEDKEKK